MSPRARFATAALLLYGVFCIVAGILVAEMTLHPQRRLLDTQAVSEGREVARRSGSNLRDIYIRTQDNLVLKAWLLQPVTNNGNAVLLLHGLGDNRIGMLGYAELLLDHGYSVLLPDARAHGQSEGAIATYGLLERQDIRDWARWAVGGRASEVHIWFRRVDGSCTAVAVARRRSSILRGGCRVFLL